MEYLFFCWRLGKVFDSALIPTVGDRTALFLSAKAVDVFLFYAYEEEIIECLIAAEDVTCTLPLPLPLSNFLLTSEGHERVAEKENKALDDSSYSSCRRPGCKILHQRR